MIEPTLSPSCVVIETLSIDARLNTHAKSWVVAGFEHELPLTRGWHIFNSDFVTKVLGGHLGRERAQLDRASHYLVPVVRSSSWCRLSAHGH